MERLGVCWLVLAKFLGFVNAADWPLVAVLRAAIICDQLLALSTVNESCQFHLVATTSMVKELMWKSLKRDLVIAVWKGSKHLKVLGGTECFLTSS